MDAQTAAYNAASRLSPASPGGAIAQGSIFRISSFSVNAKGRAEYPIQPELSGIRVEIETDEGAVFEALPLNFFFFWLDFLLPSDVPVGEHSLTLIQDGERTELNRIKVVRISPGLFTTSNYGRPELAGQDLMQPAARGDHITLWATGLGPIESPDTLPPPVGDLPTELTVTIGSADAQILYQGRAPCCAGLDQIDILIPEEAPLGCSVPIWVTAYGSLYSNIAALAIAEPGRDCWEAEDELAKPFVDVPTGRALFSRFTDHEDESFRSTYDGRAGFRGPVDDGQEPLPGTVTGFNDGYPIPPRGACTPQLEGSLGRPGFGPSYDGFMGLYDGSPLDAGQRFELEAPLGPSNMTLPSPNEWFLQEEWLQSFTANPRVTLLPGPYRLESEGGPGFPAFTADFDLPPAPLWTNREALDEFPRTNGLRLEWQGGDPADDRLVTLTPEYTCADGPCIVPAEPKASFVCRAAEGAQVLEVPPAFLANEVFTTSRLQLTNLPRPVEMQFETDGPETGLVVVRDSESVPLALDLPHLASTPVTLPDGSLVQAELAANPSERQRGLMFRPSLPQNGGMLFLFNQSARWSFWMFNTLIPLDILWLNEDREIIFINRDAPPCPGQPCPTYGPNAPSRSVLELAAGEADRRNLQVGDRLDW